MRLRLSILVFQFSISLVISQSSSSLVIGHWTSVISDFGKLRTPVRRLHESIGQSAAHPSAERQWTDSIPRTPARSSVYLRWRCPEPQKLGLQRPAHLSFLHPQGQ